MAKRRLAGGVILCLALSVALASEPPTTVVIGTPPQPGWTQLNQQQRNILAPLGKDWDNMENVRKRKWLGIADRYPNMKADEQQRIQARMREWVNLSPIERTKARDSFKDFSQLPPEQKKTVKQKWEAYSNLPPEEKQRVRETGKSSKLLAPPPAAETKTEENLPPTSEATPSTSGTEIPKR